MTPEERSLLIQTARAVLQIAWWGQNTGVDPRQAHELNKALEAFSASQQTVAHSNGERS